MRTMSGATARSKTGESAARDGTTSARETGSPRSRKRGAAEGFVATVLANCAGAYHPVHPEDLRDDGTRRR